MPLPAATHPTPAYLPPFLTAARPYPPIHPSIHISSTPCPDARAQPLASPRKGPHFFRAARVVKARDAGPASTFAMITKCPPCGDRPPWQQALRTLRFRSKRIVLPVVVMALICPMQLQQVVQSGALSLDPNHVYSLSFCRVPVRVQDQIRYVWPNRCKKLSIQLAHTQILFLGSNLWCKDDAGMFSFSR